MTNKTIFPLKLLCMPAIVSILSGCLSVDEKIDFQDRLSFEIPEKWSTSSKPEIFDSLKGWLKEFDNPELHEAIYEALENNQDLAAASARMNARLAESRIANADLLPNLTGALGASRNQRTSSSGFQLINPRTTTYSANLATNWELDLWGRIRNRKNATLADFRSSEATYRAQHLSIAAQVTKEWYNTMEANLQKSLLKKNRQ